MKYYIIDINVWSQSEAIVVLFTLDEKIYEEQKHLSCTKWVDAPPYKKPKGVYYLETCMKRKKEFIPDILGEIRSTIQQFIRKECLNGDKVSD